MNAKVIAIAMQKGGVGKIKVRKVNFYLIIGRRWMKMFEMKKCESCDKWHININSDLNLKYAKIVLLLGITAIILWLGMNEGGWLYILSVGILTMLTSILALEFYPFSRRSVQW